MLKSKEEAVELIPFLGFLTFVLFVVSIFLWIARRKDNRKRVLWRNVSAASFLILVILLAVDGAFTETPTQEATNEMKERQSEVLPAVETPDQNNEYKKIISQLYTELMTKYEAQKQSYNEVEWAAFLRDFRNRHKIETDKMTNASIKMKTAMADLLTLSNEMTNDLQGRKADIEFFKNSIQEAIK